MGESSKHIQDSIAASAELLGSLAADADAIDAIAGEVVDALAAGHKVLTAGHGGSAADALHMAEELVGRFDGDRMPLPAIALVADATALTCIANDFGYAEVFARQVAAHGRVGDVLVLFSTSGNSAGLAEALRAARAAEMTTIALLGKGGGAIAGQAEYTYVVPSDSTARIQEAHTLILHLILEAVERRFGRTG